MNLSEFEDAYDDVKRDLDDVLETPVSQVMVRQLFAVAPEATIVEAVNAMNEHHTGCVLVLKAGKLVGILTERDLLRKVIFHDGNRSWQVQSVMTPDPATLPETASVAYALNKMSVDGYRHIPIVGPEGNAVGVVSVKDIIQHVVEWFADGVLNLPASPDQVITKTEDGA